MKAKEYFEKYKDGFESRDEAVVNKTCVDLCSEMWNEVKKICESRHIKLMSGLNAAVKEQNQKGNAILGMMETPVLKRNFFQIYFDMLQKRVEQEFDRKLTSLL